MLATSLRMRPWTLRERRESSCRLTTAVLPSMAIVTSGSSRRVSVALGPSTRTAPSATCSFTPSGIWIGSRPMRDISLSPCLLPYLANDLAAHTLAACLAVGEDALRRRQDADAEAAPHGGDLAVSDVDAEAGAADPPDAGDHGAAPLIVAQPDAQHRERLLLDQPGLGQVALLDQNPRDRLLVARPRHVDAGLARAGTVADAGEHVGDRIGHHYRVTSSPSRARE